MPTITDKGADDGDLVVKFKTGVVRQCLLNRGRQAFGQMVQTAAVLGVRAVRATWRRTAVIAANGVTGHGGGLTAPAGLFAFRLTDGTARYSLR
jgi:hypothetical protein